MKLKLSLLIFIIFSITPLFAEVWQYNEMGFFGLAGVSERKIFYGEKTEVSPTLLAYYDNSGGRTVMLNGGQLFFQVARLNGPFGAGVVAKIRNSEGYTKGNPDFEGFDERRDTVEAGAYIGSPGINLSATTDLFGVHQGWEANLYGGTAFIFGDIIFNPSLNLGLKDKNLTNYYYSPSDEEADKFSIEAYKAERSSTALLSAKFFYDLGGYYLHFFVEGTFYSKEITDSPLVERGSSNSFLVGISKIFINR